MLKIGQLVVAMIVKNLPDQPGYLTLIGDAGSQLAVLPKALATRAFKIRDGLTAAVWNMGVHYPVLSQASVHYYRRIGELVLSPVIQEHQVRIRAVGSSLDSPFVKVAVESLDDRDPVSLCVPYLPDFARYTPKTISLIGYVSNPEDFIAQALNPAPRRWIREVNVYRESKMAQVIVERGSIARFLGRHGTNVAMASKLTGYRIRVDEPA
ncbi:MAG: hypothetical protein NPIRA02_01140 [Nitrospirales bacterium]|nr:MAG: hypothetical protein NPIRA02_01140 [Nitrospirales bacterium]